MVHKVWSKDQHKGTTQELVRHPNSTFTDSKTGLAPQSVFTRLPGDSGGWDMQSIVNL